MIAVSVPSVGLGAAGSQHSPDKAHTVFKVEVLYNGRKHAVEKRYSEFHALHKRIKKLCKVPDFPPKRVPNWMTKVLEQRRQGLEVYIQGVVYYNEELPKEVLDFLKLRHGYQDPKGSNLASPCAFPVEESRFLLTHRPVLSFYKDPYMLPPATNLLPDTVLSGVLQGLYAPENTVYRTLAQQGSCAHTDGNS